MYELNDKEIGAHLKELMNGMGYKTTAAFCRKYLFHEKRVQKACDGCPAPAGGGCNGVYGRK